MKPFKVIGNVYFIGCEPASSHMIDTGEGLILIDTGYPQGLNMLIENIYHLGFSPYDVKYIIHSHGHYDHCGATRGFVELYGSKTFIGKGDENYVNGCEDLTWAKELGYKYNEVFDADYIMNDGDIFSLGNTNIKILSTPGHTPGTISLFFETEENGKKYSVGMFGGAGTNSMAIKWLDEYGLSHDCRSIFLNSLEKLKKIDIDVPLGNHCLNNDTVGKYKRSLVENINPFIDPEGWKNMLKSLESKMKEMIEDGI